jgi:hypothetical protein
VPRKREKTQSSWHASFLVARPRVAVSRLDPALTRSAVVFSVFFVLLGLGLHAMYRSPTFEEGSDLLMLLLWLYERLPPQTEKQDRDSRASPR